MRNFSLCLCLALLVCIAPGLEAQDKGGAMKGLTLIKGGRIHSMTDQGCFEGDILIRGGKIAKISKEIKLPPQIPKEVAKRFTIDARGLAIAPGLIDANSSYLLLPGSGSPGSCALDIFDYFEEEKMEWAIKRGVTALALSPKPKVGVSCCKSLVKLIPRAPVEKMTLKKELALMAGLDLNMAGRPLVRLKNAQSLDKTFKAAKDYQEAWEDYREELKEYVKKITPKKEKEAPEKKDAPKEEKKEEPKPKPEKDKSFYWDSKKPDDKKDKKKKDEPKKPKEPAFAVQNEVLVKAMKGEISVHLEAHRVQDILFALELKKKYTLDLVLVGCAEGHLVADQIKEAKVPVILGRMNRSIRVEPNEYFNHQAKTARLFAEKKILFALASSGGRPDETRFLGFIAADAVGAGLDPNDALKAVTLNPAKILGVDDRIGALKKGMEADLVLFKGCPLESDARVQMVFVNGEAVYKR